MWTIYQASILVHSSGPDLSVCQLDSLAALSSTHLSAWCLAEHLKHVRLVLLVEQPMSIRVGPDKYIKMHDHDIYNQDVCVIICEIYTKIICNYPCISSVSHYKLFVVSWYNRLVTQALYPSSISPSCRIKVVDQLPTTNKGKVHILLGSSDHQAFMTGLLGLHLRYIYLPLWITSPPCHCYWVHIWGMTGRALNWSSAWRHPLPTTCQHSQWPQQHNEVTSDPMPGILSKRWPRLVLCPLVCPNGLRARLTESHTFGSTTFVLIINSPPRKFHLVVL